MTEFTGRRHRLNIPSSSGSDDPAVLKKEMATMRQLMMDEFNRMADDFYTFKRTTFEAGVIPLKQVNNLAVTYDEYSVSAMWENPQPDDLVPTHVRVRILEVSPNEWAEYTYPKDTWEFNGLEAGTQYTLQVQLIGRYEASDTFVSTTRNCPSVPVLRIAESAIKAKVFTTDAGVDAPTDPGLTDPEIEFPFPTPPGTPAVVGPTGCHWEYQFQVFSITLFTWQDIGSATTFSGLVSSVVIDTSAAPFSSFTDGVFRMKYRSICDNVAGDWIYTPSFTLADATTCGPATASASASLTPYSTADLFAIPVPCFGYGDWLFAKDSVSGNEIVQHSPAHSGIGRVDDEWTVFSADTSTEATGYGQLATAQLPLIADLHDTSDFSFSIDLWMDAAYFPGNGSTEPPNAITYPIMILGNKIQLAATFFTSTWSAIVTVPRDGGGAYTFRADDLAYAAWNEIFYVHDVSEADGRTLYVGGIQKAQSANAIENDFDGIDDTYKIYAVPEMRYRRNYGWMSVVSPPIVPTTAPTIRGEGVAARTSSGTLGAGAGVAGTVADDLIICFYTNDSNNAITPDAEFTQLVTGTLTSGSDVFNCYIGFYRYDGVTHPTATVGAGVTLLTYMVVDGSTLQAEGVNDPFEVNTSLEVDNSGVDTRPVTRDGWTVSTGGVVTEPISTYTGAGYAETIFGLVRTSGSSTGASWDSATTSATTGSGVGQHHPIMRYEGDKTTSFTFTDTDLIVQGGRFWQIMIPGI